MLTVKAEGKKEDTYKTGNLTTDQQREVKGVIQKNEDIFIKGKYEVGRTNMVKHTIDTGEEKPIKQKARRLSVKEKEIEKEHIEGCSKRKTVVRKISTKMERTILYS